MKMIVFHTDLDNTLIYSYKHEIGENKKNVELYQGREISFVTKKTDLLLKKLQRQIQIVPITTRTIEQYERIHFGIDPFPYALVCNGGVLLINGKKEEAWYRRSQDLVSESREEMEKARKLLEKEPRRKFELRYIEQLFLFTKCSEPEVVTESLKTQLDTCLVDVCENGEKVYVLPSRLKKGTALERFKERFSPERILAAGDSEFDLSMVQSADIGLVPHGYGKKYDIKKHVIEMPEGQIFSEALLEKIQRLL